MYIDLSDSSTFHGKQFRFLVRLTVYRVDNSIIIKRQRTMKNRIDEEVIITKDGMTDSVFCCQFLLLVHCR
jgi:hypothetical protein